MCPEPAYVLTAKTVATHWPVARAICASWAALVRAISSVELIRGHCEHGSTRHAFDGADMGCPMYPIALIVEPAPAFSGFRLAAPVDGAQWLARFRAVAADVLWEVVAAALTQSVGGP